MFLFNEKFLVKNKSQEFHDHLFQKPSNREIVDRGTQTNNYSKEWADKSLENLQDERKTDKPGQKILKET